MNIEISLLLAHLCLIEGHWAIGDEFMCRLVGIFLHFFWTVVFAFFMLESMFMYSILANVVKKDGMMSHIGNFCAGWGIGKAQQAEQNFNKNIEAYLLGPSQGKRALLGGSENNFMEIQ